MTEPTAVFDGRTAELTRQQADEVYERAARRYAEQASGEVTVTVHDVLVASVFLQRDLPTLRANPAVTALRLVDPATGEEQVLPRGEF